MGMQHFLRPFPMLPDYQDLFDLFAGIALVETLMMLG